MSIFCWLKLHYVDCTFKINLKIVHLQKKKEKEYKKWNFVNHQLKGRRGIAPTRDCTNLLKNVLNLIV